MIKPKASIQMTDVSTGNLTEKCDKAVANGDKTTSEACQEWVDYLTKIYSYDKYQISKQNIKNLINTFKILTKYFKDEEEKENDKGITW